LFIHIAKGIGNREQGAGSREQGAGSSDAARSWGFPPETKPDYVEPLWLVGYAEKG